MKIFDMRIAIVFFALSVTACGEQSEKEQSDTETKQSTTYSSPITLQKVDTGFSASLVIDLNGDGLKDLFAIPNSGLTGGDKLPVIMFINDGNGGLQDRTSSLITGSIPEIYLGRDIHAADFNGDQVKDIFISNHGKEPEETEWLCEKNTLLLSQPNGTFVEADTSFPGEPDFSHGSTFADFDGDTDIDIWVNNLGCGPTSVPSYLINNDGYGQFTFTASIDSDFASNNNSQYIATESKDFFWSQAFDLNDDGFPEIYYGGANGVNSALLNDGSGGFTGLPNQNLPDAPTNYLTQASRKADLDGDGYDDLILLQNPANASGFQFQLLINNFDDPEYPPNTMSDQTALRLPSQTSNTGQGNPEFWLQDIESDGDLDILVAGYGHDWSPDTDIVIFYINDGRGHFSKLMPSEMPDIRPQFIPIELNGDGQLDMLFFDSLTENEQVLRVVYSN